MAKSPNLTTVGLLQFAPVFGDIPANIRKIDHLIDNSPPVDLWVLPELASSGYNFTSREEAFASSEPPEDSLFVQYLTEKAREQETIFISGINERDGDHLYNSAVGVGPQGLMGVYRKLHLFNREKQYFKPGNQTPPIWDTPIGKIGILICFDWMFPEVWRILALRGAEMICHPSNLVLPYCQSAIPGYALTNRIFIATTNRVGREKDLEFTGQSVLVNPKGEYLLKGHCSDEEPLISEINLSEASDKQMTPFNDAIEDRREDIYEITEKNNTRND
ncbi:MAG: nitrilase-related carbon-nitrogen hydrolase [Marinilabilia sp.]